MRIWISSLLVDDQAKALEFYTAILGFQLKEDQPAGEYRWLTVVNPQDPDGIELSLEPSVHEAVSPYKTKLKQDGIPMTSFAVDDIKHEHRRLLALGVEFTQEPAKYEDVIVAVLDDTCGNLIQLIQLKP